MTSIPVLIVESVQHFPRLYESLKLPNTDQVTSYYQVIVDEDDYGRQCNTIYEEIRHCVEQLFDYVDVWSPFKGIWEVDKEAFMNAFDEPDPSVYDVNITVYSETANQVQLQEVVSTVYFVDVNASKMKNSVMVHVDQWKEEFTNLLKKNAYDKISSKYLYLSLHLY